MTKKQDISKLRREIVRMRLAQMVFNEFYKRGEFLIPVHLAMGHETLAIAVSANMEGNDQIVASHRNVHYNLAREKSARKILDEYLLKKSGLARGELGSMNLSCVENGVAYSSSILGNNMTFATGLALANRVKRQEALVTVVTGDGAMEEGAFYESILFQKSNHLSCLTLIEDNEWSLGSKISERRCPIDTAKVVDGLGVPFRSLRGNSLEEYLEVLKELRQISLRDKTPVCLQVTLHTLGDSLEVKPDYPDGKYINYHAGPSKVVHLEKGPIIREHEGDPVFVLRREMGVSAFEALVKEETKAIEEELK